jgi:hypothetical protein
VYDIQIKTTDGVYRYNAHSYGCKDQALWVQVGDLEADKTDTIYFSPSYWQAYVVDSHHDDDPFGAQD